MVGSGWSRTWKVGTVVGKWPLWGKREGSLAVPIPNPSLLHPANTHCQYDGRYFLTVPGTA